MTSCWIWVATGSTSCSIFPMSLQALSRASSILAALSGTEKACITSLNTTGEKIKGKCCFMSLFSQMTYADEQKCLHKCSLAWNTFAWMAYGRKAVLTSGLLYSEGGLLCWSWGHAYKKNRYRLYCNSSYLDIEYTVIASVIFVTSLHLLYCPLVQTRATGL